MTNDDKVRKALVEAQKILAAYIEPGRRDAEETVSRLITMLDDEDLVRALREKRE